MKPFRLTGFLSRLLLLVALAVGPALAVLLYTAVAQRQQAEEHAEREVLSLVQLASAEQERAIEGTRQLLMSLAQYPALRRGEWGLAQPVLSRMLREFPQYENLGVIDAGGRLVASALPAPAGLDLSDRGYFQRAMTSRSFAAGDFQIGRVTGTPVVNFGFPIVDDRGRIRGVVYSAMGLGWLSRLAAQTRLPEGAVLTLVDRRGLILARHPAPEPWVGKRLPDEPLLREIQSRRQGVVQTRGLDGVMRIYGFTTLRAFESSGVRLSVSLSRQSQFAVADGIFARSLLGLGGVGMLALVAALVGGHLFFARRVDALVRAAQRVRAGELGVRSGLPDHRDELGELARTFDAMSVELERRAEERQAAEQALSESEERYRSLVESFPDTVFVRNGDRIVYVNPAGMRLFGAARVEELVGQPALDRVHPDCREQVRERIAHLSETGFAPPVELKLLRLDGSAVEVEATAVAFRQAGVEGSQVIARDVTDRKRLEEQFRQAQKMEAIGRLAGGVAHDFNNLLTAILGYAALLKPQVEGLPKAGADVEEICRAGERAAALTRQLLTFSRRHVLEPSVVDLNAVTVEISQMLRRVIGEDIELTCHTAPDLGAVRAEPRQLEQAIMNLVVNARDAMPNGGVITLTTANVDLDEAYTRRQIDARPGSYVMLAVSDTGNGISPEARARLFEPFFTTKEPGKGTGLGLSTVYGVVKQSGGHIEVQSEPGQGATFRLFLPRHRPARALTAAPERAPLVSGSERILLVEDDALVRGVVMHVLRDAGYAVTEARDGREALRCVEAAPQPFDLLLTDTVMPHLSGPELVARIQRLRPVRRVLYISGYAPGLEIGPEAPGAFAGAEFLQKPFTPEALASKVRTLLDRPLDRAA